MITKIKMVHGKSIVKDNYWIFQNISCKPQVIYRYVKWCHHFIRKYSSKYILITCFVFKYLKCKCLPKYNYFMLNAYILDTHFILLLWSIYVTCVYYHYIMIIITLFMKNCLFISSVIKYSNLHTLCLHLQPALQAEI